MGDYILTYSKEKFYPLEPNIHDIKVSDIAHSLSLLSRANGHYKHFYSVAQHSLACYKEAASRGYSKRVQLGCLLHDGSEAYIGDITRPFKKNLDNYLIVEERLQNLIYEKFDIGDLTKDERKKISEVDDTILYYEFKELMGVDLYPKSPFLSGDHSFEFKDFKLVENEFIFALNHLW